VLVFLCPIDGWDASADLGMAVHLADGGEVVVPGTLRHPEAVDGELRGQARLRLLEAAMLARGQRVRRRIEQGTPAPASLPLGP
jgi:hypothetical protein